MHSRPCGAGIERRATTTEFLGPQQGVARLQLADALLVGLGGVHEIAKVDRDQRPVVDRELGVEAHQPLEYVVAAQCDDLGHTTGIDLGAIIAIARTLPDLVGHPMPSRVSAAGPLPHFNQ